MADLKVMNFDQFNTTDPLQDADTALKGNTVDPVKKEPFVNQVKHADLTELDVTEPDYEAVDEDATSDIANLQSTVTNLERQVIDYKKTAAETLNQMEFELQTKREALNQAIAAQAAAPATPTQVQTQQPASYSTQPAPVAPPAPAE